jgi:hypothetical protein
MSGPTTVIVTGNPAAILIAAAAIRAAQAIAQAHEQAAAQRQSNQEEARLRDRALVQASATGRSALAQAAQSARDTFLQLHGLGERLGLPQEALAVWPAEPEVTSDEALAAYVRTLTQLNEQVRSILLTESARLGQDEQVGPDFSQATAQALSQRLAQRLLARLSHLQDLPPSLLALARELDQTAPGQRAELLASELRHQIQSHAQEVQQRQVQEATALVMEQSLRDLGYQVEELSQTLFVQGGVVHFRRSDWGAYMVRMRVDAQGRGINFNVIRAVAQGENERSVRDHLAEDRWCAEFPTLLKTLEARGVNLQVTRRLQAGELPVQLVNVEQLPRFAQEEHRADVAEPLKRSLP